MLDQLAAVATEQVAISIRLTKRGPNDFSAMVVVRPNHQHDDPRLKNLKPLFLRGDIPSLQRELTSQNMLSMFGKNVQLATAVEIEGEGKKATKKTATKKAPEATTEVKNPGQIDLAEQAEELTKATTSVAAVTATPVNKEIRKFNDLLDELEFLINNANRKAALAKIEEIMPVGKVLSGQKLVTKDMGDRFKTLRDKANQLPEELTAQNVTASDEDLFENP